MADLPRDSPVKPGEEPMARGDALAQPNSIDMVATAKNESTGGQSDSHHDDGATIGTTSQDPRSRDGRSELSGDGSIASGNPISEDAGPTSIDETTRDIGELRMDTDQKPKKKKNKNKRTGAASRKHVTGFEEFFADAPMTPAEAAHEKKEIYSKSRTFAQRMEECIQRYRVSRRMDSERTMIFNKYLWLGGIDSSPRQFTGFAGDGEALAEADADEIRQMTAVDFIGGSGTRFYDPLDGEHWFVDFEGIVRGFLSRTIIELYMYDEQAIKMAADLIKNFLNYVLMHDVCPEYIDDVMAARDICNIAPIELRSAHELTRALPGAFNESARLLFCDRLVDNLDVAENFDKLIRFRVTVLLSMQVDQKVKDKITSMEDPSNIRVVGTKEETYKVVDIIQPRRKDVIMVEEQLRETGHGGKAKLAGALKLKPSIVETGYDNVPRADEIDLSNAESEDYLLENDLLLKFEKGMKIEAVVCELNIGIRFIKEILNIHVSFDLFLPQMLMKNWKDPVPNERPPPSAANPGFEEEVVDSHD
ncbi:hypothetical protein AAE478_001939 [Parahypoxylon ruwenzoriense]